MEPKNLQQIYEANPESDKGTVHSYISYYEESLKLYRHTAEKVLEIGVLDGGSTRLWKNYFDKAFIVGIDIGDSDNCREMGKLVEKGLAENLRLYYDNRVHFISNQKLI